AVAGFGLLLAAAAIVLRDLLVLRHLADRGIERDLLLVAPDLDLRLFADRGLSDDKRQVTHLVDGVAVEGLDDIALLEAGLRRRSTRRHIGDERAFGL